MVLVNGRWHGSGGIGRFSDEVLKRLTLVNEIDSRVGNLSIFDSLWQTFQIYKEKPSVYYNPGYNPPLWSIAPYIFTIHDLNHLHSFGNHSFLKSIYYNFVMKRGCRNAEKIITVSEFSKNEIIDWSGVESSKVVNVGNAVEFSCYESTIPIEQEYILYVGNNKPHKNIARLIVAFAKSGINDDIKLVLVGEKNESVKKILIEQGVEKRVEFSGFVREEALPSLYKNALFTVFPSLYEGFGLPIIESMACGTPVLTSNTTACAETAGNAALTVNPYDVEEIKDAMLLLSKDRGLREKLIQEGYRNIKRFSWDGTAEKIQTVINEVHL